MKSSTANLLLLIGSIVACLVGGELAARWLLPPQPIYLAPQPKHEPHPRLGWVLRPDQDSFTQDKPVHINSLGLRDDDDLPTTKESSERRVLVLGDSFTFGNGVHNRDTYAERLEALLLEAGIPARVLNAGVQGYDIHQEVIYFRERGAYLESDLVIVGVYMNDVKVRREPYQPTAIETQGPLPAAWLYRIKRLRSLVFGASLVREVRWRFFPPASNYHTRALFFDEESPQSERAWTDIEASLAELRDAARETGAPLLVVVFPHHGQMADAALTHTYQGRLASISDALGIDRIDLLAPFRDAARRGTSPYIPFDGHANPLGHRIAAEQLRPKVMTLLQEAR